MLFIHTRILREEMKTFLYTHHELASLYSGPYDDVPTNIYTPHNIQLVHILCDSRSKREDELFIDQYFTNNLNLFHIGA